LVTPVIRDVDKKSVADLVTEYEDVVSRARAGQLKEKDFVGGTFTITNLGMLGVDSFTPVINPPQVAILGINRIKDVVVLENNEPRLAKSMTLSLSVDHRVVDGAPGARFYKKLKNILRMRVHLSSQDSRRAVSVLKVERSFSHYEETLYWHHCQSPVR